MRASLLVLGLASLSLQPTPPRVVLVAGGGIVQEPFGVAFDRAGRTYIVDMGGHRISRLDAQGHPQPFAGTGEPGLAGDDGPAARAQFNGPHHILIGPDDQLYVADTGNRCVRRIDLRTGIISRVAGTGEKGFSGDDGPATRATFGGIYALAIAGRRLYICDLDNRRVRAMDLRTGVVSTVAGNGEKGIPVDGENARTQPLVDPRAIAVDSQGTLYILERNGHALRLVDRAGRIHTVAGTGEPGLAGNDGPARQAQFRGPKHISVDADDSVLICDTENHMIRRYSPKTRTISLVAGTGTAGSAGLDGPADRCELDRPHGILRHPRTGRLYIADSDNHRVLRLDP